MSQKDVIREMFQRYGFVTNRMMQQAGITHTGRNRIGELEREEFIPNGQCVEFTTGKEFLDNRWDLKWATKQED